MTCSRHGMALPSLSGRAQQPGEDSVVPVGVGWAHWAQLWVQMKICLRPPAGLQAGFWEDDGGNVLGWCNPSLSPQHPDLERLHDRAGAPLRVGAEAGRPAFPQGSASGMSRPFPSPPRTSKRGLGSLWGQLCPVLSPHSSCWHQPLPNHGTPLAGTGSVRVNLCSGATPTYFISHV